MDVDVEAQDEKRNNLQTSKLFTQGQLIDKQPVTMETN